MTHGWRAVLAVMWAGLAACGGTERIDPDVPAEPVERADFNEKAAEALCERFIRCGLMEDAARCREQQLTHGYPSLSGLGTRYDEALESGRIHYSPEVAGQCIQLLREGSCDEAPMSLPMQDRGMEYDTRCRFLQGQVTDGGACQWSTECRDGAYCDATVTSCGGVCRRGTPAEPVTAFDGCAPGTVLTRGKCLTPGGEGTPCGGVNGEAVGVCGQGLWCDSYAVGTCRRVSTEGGACEDFRFDQCGWSLYCRDGRCQKPRGEGAPCEAPSFGRFGTQECRDELFCDAEEGGSGSCRPKLTAGAACRNAFECEDSMDCPGAKPQEGVRGTCRPNPRLGEPCAERFCSAGLICSSTTQTCIRTVRLGEPCEDAEACHFSGTCVDGTCQPVGARSCN
ncbi:hypothetical protein [Pyxidicoccus sp. MSG2]|uniref:hypothetical protein n=1 Tax=Pyxidicoccus sp. MSG2 TaxID=2996790 RepID=UPI0022710857|nr:hypothetical protein [Pyxidicoccus sp. MSG2]MCY1017586.1 hypothetical protein [Pyxidicoccus sp. MSG2]